MSRQYFDVANKLNLKTTDFLCYIGNGERNSLFPDIASSVKGIVVYEPNEKTRTYLQTNEHLNNIKFVSNFYYLDESAYDKIVYLYDEEQFENKPVTIIQKLIECCDNKGLVLISGITNRDYGDFVDLLKSEGILNVWVLRNEKRDRFDLLFRVVKY